MKRIVISSNSCWNIYNFRYNLIKSLIKKNFKIYIFANKDDSYKLLERMGCQIIFIKFSRKKKSVFESIIVLYKYYINLVKIKPQLYFSYTIKPNLLGGLIANFLKINTIINFTGLGTLALKKNFSNKLIIYLFKLILIKSKIVFFHNNQDLNFLKNKKISKNFNYEVIPGSGVDLYKFKYSPLTNNKNHHIIFLFIGRIIKDKGIIEFIKAANIINSKYINTEFIVLGDNDNDNISNLSPNQISKINKKNIVKFVGFKNNIIQYITNSTCVVLPSYREGLSKSLLEACSIGRPIVTTDVPGCNDIVLDDYNGFLCKPYDFLSLSNSLEKFVNLPFNEKIHFGERSRKIAEKKFDENIVISRYMNAIEKYV